ncbi:hypothetical protein M407DRAFT_30959 [Tulasnella calospora MUT 4182]|uniref:Protein kinase domain-containing protein n=1 Tax=Tulasnella calospora MUT 4182 TaxID=1051891 RepID=A0A0C3PWL2_9AGAM|nr:hypothetical protein M407DRAFT_30959 [Tulasnella calospora MUT 4182]
MANGFQIYGVALGLEYLHTCQPPIRHGDLKSLDIFVNSSNCAVIADFGSARIVERETASAPHPAAAAGHTPSKWSESAEFKITDRRARFVGRRPNTSMETIGSSERHLGTRLDWLGGESAITDSYPFEDLDLEVLVPMKVIEGQLPMIYDHDQFSQIHELCSIMQKCCWRPDPRERLSITECRKTIGWVTLRLKITSLSNFSEYLI